MFKNFIITMSMFLSLSASNQLYASNPTEENRSDDLRGRMLFPCDQQDLNDLEDDFDRYDQRVMQKLYDKFGEENVKRDDATLYKPGDIFRFTYKRP
jgi:hypothetical protein